MAMLDFFGSGMLNAAEELVRKNKATDGMTNPNAKPGKKGKNAKSNKAGKRAADLAMQQQMQADQFKFLQDNIFDRTGATRRTMSGQIERNVPQGMDYFKNTGPDRPEVAARQSRLDSQGLKNPNIWNQAQEDVNLASRKQAEPVLFGAPAQPGMDQILKTPTNNMDVFNNPDGSFVRSRPNPYGTARNLFTPNQGEVTVGPVEQVFAPQAPTQQPQQNIQQLFTPPANITPPSPMWGAPQNAVATQPQQTPGFGDAGASWLDLFAPITQFWQQQLGQQNQQTNMEDLARQYTSGDRFMGL